ncbi:MAG: DUF222 domain-containing protein [Actinomycetota bacterium]
MSVVTAPPGARSEEVLAQLAEAGQLVLAATQSSPSVAAAGGSDALCAVLGSARQVQAHLDALITSIGIEADRLAASGRSAPAAELLLGRGEVRAGTARQEAAHAEVAGWMPGVASALRSGGIGAAHLDSLARHTKRLDPEHRAALPVGSLLIDAARLPADTFDAVVRRAVQAVDVGAAQRSANENRQASEFRHWADERTGMGRFSGALDPERYEIFAAAIERRAAHLAATSDEASALGPNLAAAALVDLVTASATATDGSGRSPARLSVVVGVEALAEIRAGSCGDGTPSARTGAGRAVTDAAVQRLLCDAELRRVVLDERGVPIDVGRSRRTASDAQWTALRAIHTTCGWPGCRRPIDHCQVHHVQPWACGGATDLANLLPLCSEHHHRVHEGGWTMQLSPDRVVRVTRPDGAAHHVGRTDLQASAPAPVRPEPPCIRPPPGSR